MLGSANCLVLDEPTNHLDIDSAEVLESALDSYDGTVVVISHDRYFLDRIADRTIEMRDGELHTFEGSYSAWREWKEEQVQAQAQVAARAAEEARLAAEAARKAQTKAQARAGAKRNVSEQKAPESGATHPGKKSPNRR